nr:MAG TPA: hypothetical protein [Caudoviricetes sp.]
MRLTSRIFVTTTSSIAFNQNPPFRVMKRFPSTPLKRRW